MFTGEANLSAPGGTVTGGGPSKGGEKEARYDRSGSTGPDRGRRPGGVGGVRQRLGRLLSEAVGGVGKLVPGVHPSSVPTGP
jgi:hypothetical protein